LPAGFLIKGTEIRIYVNKDNIFPLQKEEAACPEESFSSSRTKETAQNRKKSKRRKPMRQPKGGSDFSGHPSLFGQAVQ